MKITKFLNIDIEPAPPEMESDRVIREMRKEKRKPTNPIKKFFRIP